MSCRALLAVAACSAVAAWSTFGGEPSRESPGLPAARPLHLDDLGDALPPGAVARLGTARLRHVNNVLSVLFTPDGRHLISGGLGRQPVCGLRASCGQVDRRTIRIWDAASGRPVCQFGHSLGEEDAPEGMLSLALSADGKVLASLNQESSVCVWEPAVGTLVREFAVQDGDHAPCAFAISPDGKTLATVGEGPVRLWDVSTGKLTGKLGEGGRAITYSRDGKTLFDGQTLWEMPAGRARLKLSEGPRASHLAELSADGTLVMGEVGDELVIWKADSGDQVARFMGGPSVVAAFSPDGKLCAIGDSMGEARVRELATGAETKLFDEPGEGVQALAFSPDGKRLATAGANHTVRLWDVASGKENPARPVHRGPVRCVAFSPDGKTLASAGERCVQLWDLGRAVPVRQWEGEPGNFRTIAFSPDGTTLATSDLSGSVQLRAVARGKTDRVLPGPDDLTHVSEDCAWSLAFTPDGKALAVADVGGSFRVREVATGKEVQELSKCGEEEWVERYVAFSPDGTLLASGGEMGVVRIWDWRGKKVVQRLLGHEIAINAVAFSPDGRFLASAGADRTLRLWDPVTGRERLRLDAGDTSVQSVAFSLDGRLLATHCFLDNAVRVWEVASAREVARLEGHDGWVTCVAFCPDGRRLASGGSDSTVLVWDLAEMPGGDERRPPLHFAALWDELASGDASTAYRAVWRLAAHPGPAVALLRRRLRPTAAAPPERVAALVRELDSDSYATRARAQAELERFEEAAWPALREALCRPASLEVRRRLDGLTERLESATEPEELLRATRALAVLERCATPEARDLLAALARGDPRARLTREAKATLVRLSKGPPGGP